MICNICQNTKFGDYRGRKAVRCMRCYSLERHRDAWGVLSGMDLRSVLYFGPEPCLAKAIRSKCDSFKSADISPRYTATSRQDLRETTFKTMQFSHTICLHVLEHIVQTEKAIRELARLAPVAIVSVPLFPGASFRDPTAKTPSAKAIAHGQSNHEWKFGRADFHDLLLDNGFSSFQLINNVFICQSGLAS